MKKATEMVATEIKAPGGSVCQKFVYTCFMVKMRINLDLLGSFSSIWARDNTPGRILGSSKFKVFQVKKFKFESIENMGYEC